MAHRNIACSYGLEKSRYHAAKNIVGHCVEVSGQRLVASSLVSLGHWSAARISWWGSTTMNPHHPATLTWSRSLSMNAGYAVLMKQEMLIIVNFDDFEKSTHLFKNMVFYLIVKVSFSNFEHRFCIRWSRLVPIFRKFGRRVFVLSRKTWVPFFLNTRYMHQWNLISFEFINKFPWEMDF